ncbi:hypothetical protein O181_059492 [Austropuccinia psidii MF-1]|uniref:Uncharacterized protein n=1 Tax=Austropuccinia psidii MF-1 TaxID=1389203 RepID=A0A9Q3HXH1_9BASI|nr:hypothetical protein [Austropuccinia psidii MF-1]
MRNLDLPPHKNLYQEINSTNEIFLLNWVQEAFTQLLYSKKLWKPNHDWSELDDKFENEERLKNLKLLKEIYQNQIIKPLQDRFGHSEVEIALSNLSEDQHIFCEPAIIWQSIDKQSGETTLEWMSEFTADVIWPGLVSCKPTYEFARRHWEAEARQFSQTVGGIACGMGENGEMLPIMTEDERKQLEALASSTDSNFSSSQERHIAESILIKQFLQENPHFHKPS